MNSVRRADWKRIENAAAAQIISAVRAVREQHPDEQVYGAMFHAFYGDDTVFSWPLVTVGTEESLAKVAAEYVARGYDAESLDSTLRWSGPDLEHNFDPSGPEQALADAVHVSASADGDIDELELAYELFMRCFPRAAKRARKKLVARAAVSREFIAIAQDEAGELVPLSLTKSQVLAYFPEYDVAARERKRLAALPVEQRLLEIVPEAIGPSSSGPLLGEYEGLVVACGAAAIPALMRVIRGEEFAGGDSTAARLLAEINIDTPDVVAALDGLMRREDAEINARSWAASALARMGHTELIAARVPELPVEVVTRGVCDPFTAFRDYGAHRPLEYVSLEALLNRYPELEVAIEDELKPGSAFCALSPGEISTARAALDSRWKVIRTHARIALTDAGVKA